MERRRKSAPHAIYFRAWFQRIPASSWAVAGNRARLVNSVPGRRPADRCLCALVGRFSKVTKCRQGENANARDRRLCRVGRKVCRQPPGLWRHSHIRPPHSQADSQDICSLCTLLVAVGRVRFKAIVNVMRPTSCRCCCKTVGDTLTRCDAHLIAECGQALQNAFDGREPRGSAANA